jgi:DNA-binding GntR family transcriptional regulator
MASTDRLGIAGQALRCSLPNAPRRHRRQERTVSTQVDGPVPFAGLPMISPQPRATAHRYVRDTLRQAILEGTLAGGTRLLQEEIARQLGVSTTPVREALRDLATDGLVRIDAHRTCTVTQLTFAELCEIHDLCRLLEPEAMREAAAVIDDATLAAAQALADQMRAESRAGQWAELNRRFHALLVDATPSDRLRRILAGLRDSSAPYVALAIRGRGFVQMEAANDQHEELLAALRQRDGQRAAALACSHVDLTVNALRAARDMFDPTPAATPSLRAEPAYAGQALLDPTRV